MNVQGQKPPTPWPMIILFFIITISVIIAGFYYYFNQKRTLLAEKQIELSTVSDLKIRQITQWRLERIGDGQFLGENILLVREFSEFLRKPTNKLLQENILQSMKSMINNYDYRNILLLDTKCNILLEYPEHDTVIGDYLRPLLPEMIKNRKVILTDLKSSYQTGNIHIDVVVPVIDYGKNDSILLGFIALRIDPKKVLYPLTQLWPTPSKSAETLLFRKEGDGIVYLSELRYMKNTEPALRKPFTAEKLPAVMAINGVTGTVDGIDYRNVPVVAAMKKIPGTSWYLVSEIDKEEIFSDLDSQMRIVVFILVLFTLTIGLFLCFLWWNQRVSFYREKYETEVKRLALVKHFDYILKFANDIILLLDHNLNVVEANDSALASYKYTRDEFIGMNLKEIRAPETLSQIPEQLKKVNENGSVTVETFHKRKDNTIFPVEISSRVVTIEGLKYYQTIGRDITDRKSAEDSLKESEDKFRKIFEESPFSMLITGKDFGILRANLSFSNLIGYREEELKSLTFRDFTHPEHIGEDEVSLMRLIAGEIPIYHTQKRYIRKDGSIIWGSTTVNIIRNNKGEVHFFLVMVDDISSRRSAQIELEKSNSLLKATLESTADGLLVVDSSGKIVQFNQKFAEMWRVPNEILRMIDDNYTLNYVKDQVINPEIFYENIKLIYSKSESTTFDLIEFKDGRFFERYSQPQMIKGKCAGRVWSFRDITEKKKAESELIAAKEKAEESDRLKTAFLHNVSHEIRTPMNAIIGFSTLLNEPEISESERFQYGDIIFQSSNQLLSIINDIVDIANVESGQVKINYREMNLNSSLLKLNEQFIYKGKEDKIPVILSLGLNEKDAFIVNDNTKLIQILSNLISNSLKFTRQGQIDFGYVLNGNFLEFFVRDTGIGISSNHVNKIFDRFYQVDRTESRQYGGTGLGLSICKAYVELLGGKIWVSSKPDEGTMFKFTIPYKRVDY
jgi:PAS domain S-box-containing protein